MVDVQRRSTLSRSWRAWAGDVDQLRRIGRSLEDAALEHPEAGQVEVRVTLVEGSDEITGSVDDVLNELDRRNVDRVTMQVEEKLGFLGKRCITIAFDPDRVYGVNLEVSSGSIGWARSSFAGLDGEISKGVPAWAWLHSPLGSACAVGAAFGVTMTSLAFVLATVLQPWIVMCMALLLVSPLLLSKVYSWFLPKFEVTGEGGESSGSRRIVALVILLAQLPIGIIVNLITSA